MCKDWDLARHQLRGRRTPVYAGSFLLLELTLTLPSGGSGPCMTNHDLLCESGSQPHKWGSASYLGLGFSCMAVIVLW